MRIRKHAAHAAIALAEKHALTSRFASSALLCLHDARRLMANANYDCAYTRAVKALQYAVGSYHPDYAKAVSLAN